MSLQFVIDGYNIIKHPLLASTSRKAKQEWLALIELINAHKLTGSPNNRVVVVFDGYPDSEFPERGLKGINIIFSRRQSADERIKAIVERSAGARNIVVVSDDKEIKFFAKSLGAKVLAVEEFIGPKVKQRRAPQPLKPELSYSQAEGINRELRKLWLGE
ncbi:MAG: NYN domain-containing protein [Candidatus Omnitrophota bacterium]|nr:NYN domain-containing protein [Candidatus Omnitrophota bacterium]